MSSGYLVKPFLAASFAVALPLASKWYPPKYQGLVMGIAGAGNSGTVFATFFAPRIAKVYGWHSVFGLALIPLAIAFIVFFFLAKDSTLVKSQPKSVVDFLRPLRSRDALLFSLLYSITFGGFVGLASFLPIFFHDQFALDKITAGNATALCVLAGSFVRPIGGYLADKFGGVRVLTVMYLIIGALSFLISGMHSLTVTLSAFVALMLCLGSGNGSVFQLVPVRFKQEVGVITGFVGAFGGVGGFFLPNILGSLKSLTGSYSSGYIVFGVTAITAAVALFYINYLVWAKENWHTTEEPVVA